MRLVVSESATELVEKRGGRLYVWVKKGGCCGGMQTLATSSEPPRGREFRSVAGTERLEVLVPAGLSRLPDELHIAVRRFPRRVEAYWNGCAWVV